jgi:hypothetical protein
VRHLVDGMVPGGEPSLDGPPLDLLPLPTTAMILAFFSHLSGEITTQQPSMSGMLRSRLWMWVGMARRCDPTPRIPPIRPPSA